MFPPPDHSSNLHVETRLIDCQHLADSVVLISRRGSMIIAEEGESSTFFPQPRASRVTMASLGRLTNAIVAANNENTLQLAGFNIDFSLLKVEAPKEFMGLGAVLSQQRKSNAEDGPLHRTARKLGALFEQLLPSTPNLIRVYGKRATNIFQTPGVNPQGSRRDGPFENFVGADGASLWAAATSGHSAVAVYLLACMLARKWDSHIAISIWVELVAERKKEIETAFKEGNVASMTVILAAGQDLTREELSLWDDSARAWLQSADIAKMTELKQLELILKNVEALIPSGANTYTNVVSAWTQAMVGLEQILLGVPQQISDGSVLLSLSAWHIFPDLLVLGSKTVNVKFGDNLVPGGGVITIGLQSTDPGQGKIKWSLALSHLRYYGDPVEVTSGGIESRVSMNQLHFAAFGSLLARWEVPIEETIPISKWFIALWARLEQTPADQRVLWCGELSLREHLNWLHVLVKAAGNLLACRAEELDIAIMIVGFGHRRGGTFLGTIKRPPTPFFGLCNRLVLLSLQKHTNVDRGIQYLREFSKMVGYEDGDAFIGFNSYNEADEESHDEESGSFHVEYATAVPHIIAGQKRHSDIEVKQPQNLWRSVNLSTNTDDKCDCDGDCGPTCACVIDLRFCNWNCHGESSFEVRNAACRNASTAFEERATEIFNQRELRSPFGRSLHEVSTNAKDSTQRSMEWVDPPLLFSNLLKVSCSQNMRSQDAACTVTQPCCCYDSCSSYVDPKDSSKEPEFESDGKEIYHSSVFDLAFSSINSSFCLWVKRNHEGKPHPKLDVRPRQADLLVNTESATKFLTLLDPGGLLEYITNMRGGRTRLDSAMSLPREIINTLDLSFLEALDTLSVASQIYEELNGATIPLGVMSMDLSSARWMDISESSSEYEINVDTTHDSGDVLPRISRAQAFACIMMFESGNLNITLNYNLASVMAISSGNSIFVPKALLSDPFENIDEYKFQRIVGNIGKPGITLLVCPQNPRIRGLSDDFRVVRHGRYDFKREDNFKETSLHLSFTDWKLPLDTGTRSWGNITKDVHFIESVVSVHDRGVWVADIDLVKDSQKLWRLVSCGCQDQEAQVSNKSSMSMRLTSIDSWDELLDSPKGIGVFRARGNWAARLAAASILGRRSVSDSNSFIVGATAPCLRCAHKLMSSEAQEGLGNGPKHPSFFVD